MSWMTKRRLAFNPAGPFVAQRNGPVGNMEFVFGETVTAEQLAEAGIDRRRLENLYSGYWMNMVPEGEPIVLDVDTPADPAADMLYGSSILPAMVPIGDTEVQLGEIVRGTFAESGLSNDAWNDLPEAERDALLQAEIDRRVAAPPPAPPPPPAPADVPQVAVAYRAVGFGKYQAVDAAGALFGKRITKVTAEQSQLPLQPQQKG